MTRVLGHVASRVTLGRRKQGTAMKNASAAQDVRIIDGIV